MDRRGFLSLLGAGVAGLALDQAIPFNRVWSFPKEIILPPVEFLDTVWITKENLLILQNNLRFNDFYNTWESHYDRQFAVGETVRVRFPQRFVFDQPS